MDINATLFGIRCQAMQWAMETATEGEACPEILTRAHMYAQFLAEPLLARAQSDEMGKAATSVVQ